MGQNWLSSLSPVHCDMYLVLSVRPLFVDRDNESPTGNSEFKVAGLQKLRRDILEIQSRKHRELFFDLFEDLDYGLESATDAR